MDQVEVEEQTIDPETQTAVDEADRIIKHGSFPEGEAADKWLSSQDEKTPFIPPYGLESITREKITESLNDIFMALSQGEFGKDIVESEIAKVPLDDRSLVREGKQIERGFIQTAEKKVEEKLKNIGEKLKNLEDNKRSGYFGFEGKELEDTIVRAATLRILGFKLNAQQEIDQEPSASFPSENKINKTILTENLYQSPLNPDLFINVTVEREPDSVDEDGDKVEGEIKSEREGVMVQDEKEIMKQAWSTETNPQSEPEKPASRGLLEKLKSGLKLSLPRK